MKGLTTIAYLSLLDITWRFVDGQMHHVIALEAAFISGLWFVLTFLERKRLFKTYFDLLSRLEIELPAAVGTILAAVAITYAVYPVIRILGFAEMIAWTAIYFEYQNNRSQYIMQGHGPVPKDCWVTPPCEALLPGDLLLTSGQVAARLRESVGHAELVLQLADNKFYALSSYMLRGFVLNPLPAVCAATSASGHYIVMRPTIPWTEAQIVRSAEIAEQMLAENQQWVKDTIAFRSRIINLLPVPHSAKKWLIKKSTPSGYDYLGLFFGRLAKRHWTCIGACLELYRRLGIKTNQYGTGLLGYGTTLLDPILPVRFLADPAFRLLTIKDKQEFEERKPILA
jgi:hypothetical protein